MSNWRRNFRQRVMAKAGGQCWYCGDWADTLDHVIPRCTYTKRRFYNASDFSNLLPACRDCNDFKGALTLEQFRTKIAEIKLLPYVIFWGETRENPCHPHYALDKPTASTQSLPSILQVFTNSLWFRPQALAKLFSLPTSEARCDTSSPAKF